MSKLKSVLATVYRSPRVRQDIFDIVKVVAGVIAAKYGIKLA